MSYIFRLVILFRIIACGAVMLLIPICMSGNTFGEVVDRVVASIDDLAITETELNEHYESVLKIDKDTTRLKTLNAMINRKLLLKDAMKYRMEGSEDEIIRQYVDLKIRALIRVSDKEVRKYYDEHREEFNGQTFEAVYMDIDRYLTEREVNDRLRKQIEMLRGNTSIQILLGGGE